MLLQASILGELGAISFPFTLNLFCSKVVFVLPMQHQFEINRGQAKKKLILEIASSQKERKENYMHVFIQPLMQGI